MSYAGILIEKYRSRGLLLDSNLLLLYLIGAAAPSLVGAGQYKKLSNFNAQEIIRLRQLISAFERVVTTAHVLTEVSNLVNALGEPRRQHIFTAFVGTLEVIREQEVPSYKVARRPEFRYLGLTDSVLAELSSEFLIVSNDGRMVDLLRRTGIEALKWVDVMGLSV